MKDREIKNAVKDQYAQIAESSGQSSCSCGCCSDESSSILAGVAGYCREDLENIPEEASLGLGCGNPVAIAELNEGETVLDLGSGAGMDVFLAASKVGTTGKVIGVDMTQAMVDKACDIAQKNSYKNVDFRLGEIEDLPVDDCSVDTIISNCVVNLSTDKSKVFKEAFRVIKPGGRLIVSDIVSEGKLPDELRGNMDAWAGCIAGSMEQVEYVSEIEGAGFVDLQVTANGKFFVEGQDDEKVASLLSITVKAYKQGREV